MNGTAVLPAVDNTTNVSDTICTVTTTTTEVPLAPLDKADDKDGGFQDDLKALSPAAIIGLAVAGLVAVLIITYFIYRRKAITMTLAMTLASKSSSSMAVMDASALSASPFVTTVAS